MSEEKGKITVTRASLKADDIPSLTHTKISDWDTEVINKLSPLETKLDTHIESDTHITSDERLAWNAKLDSIPNTYI